MIEITYKIKLYSDWHCGSGLGAGAETDNEVIKDRNSLPYIPGKTIKGLLRDAFQEIMEVQNQKIQECHYNSIFGYEIKNEDSKIIRTESGNAFFSNAELKKEEKREIISNNLQAYLYRNITSTAINERGIADAQSLRVIEVCIPIELEGFIQLKNESEIDTIKLAFQWVRHLGTNRNRGLGRCQFIIIPKTENQ